MAKKFVRGVTDVDDIEKFDKSLTNVNDLISDGQNTYVHTKKGKNESYYKLTDSLKSITSDNSDLITITKDDTTNTANIHPKHDAQKEQSLESTRGTVSIEKGGNGTNTTTKVDTNPKKVLEHENLNTYYGLSKATSGTTTTLGLVYTVVNNKMDLNDFTNGAVRGSNFLNAPIENRWFFVNSFSGENFTIQEAFTSSGYNNLVRYIRTKEYSVWGAWREQVGDKSVIDALLAQKQNTLLSNSSIAVIGNTLRQLYALKQTYNVTGGILKTHVKSISDSTNITNPEEEFNFIVKIDKSVSSVNFTLNTHDTTKFTNIMTTYGSNGTVRISGCVFTLSGSTLTVSTSNNTNQNYVITFSDII